MNTYSSPLPVEVLQVLAIVALCGEQNGGTCFESEGMRAGGLYFGVSVIRVEEDGTTRSLDAANDLNDALALINHIGKPSSPIDYSLVPYTATARSAGQVVTRRDASLPLAITEALLQIHDLAWQEYVEDMSDPMRLGPPSNAAHESAE